MKFYSWSLKKQFHQSFQNLIGYFDSENNFFGYFKTSTFKAKEHFKIFYRPWHILIFGHGRRVKLENGRDIVAVRNGNKAVDRCIWTTAKLRSHRIVHRVIVHLLQYLYLVRSRTRIFVVMCKIIIKKEP